MDNSTCQAGELRCEVHTRSGPEVQLSVAGELGDSGLVGEVSLDIRHGRTLFKP